MMESPKTKKLKPLKVWSPPKNGQPYGPNPLQRLIFIEQLPEEDTFLEDSRGTLVNIRRPHLHTQDCVLFIGGAGSGKSAACIARVISLCLQYPGTKAVIGSLNQPILKRNLIPHIKKLLSVGRKTWNHPLVRAKPTDKRPTIEFINGSEILLQNLEDEDVIRGLEGDVIMIDECNLLPSGDSVDELVRRLRGHGMPLKQLLLTMNPEASNGWPYIKFALKQFEKTYIERGGKPIEIATRCKCQFCHECLNGEKGEFGWVERKCPNCGIEKLPIKGRNGQVFDCPGDQQFYRVIRTRSADNKHNPTDYVQNMKSGMDAESFQRFVEGEIGETRQGRCYGAYGDAYNVCDKDLPINPTKDIAWALDFNTFPMCSVVLQETDHGPWVHDNIIGWDKDAEDLVEIFAYKYPLNTFTNTVHLHGDANGWWGQGSTKKKTNYQILHDGLTGKGYKVVLHVQPRKKNPSVVDRINCVNNMLRGKDGGVRLMINPQAEHLQKSLSETKWNPKTGKENDNIDVNAKRAMNKSVPMAMTHPAAALGYYVAKVFPIMKSKTPARFIHMPNNEMIVQEGGEIRTLPGLPSKKAKGEDGGPDTLSKSIKSNYGMSIPRRHMKERQELERVAAEDRERRFQEKCARLLE